MKSAEQWYKEMQSEASLGIPSTPMLERIMDIQKDAFTDAQQSYGRLKGPTPDSDRSIPQLTEGDRMLVEQSGLEDRLSRLATFMNTTSFEALDPDEKCRIARQFRAMTEYASALEERILAL